MRLKENSRKKVTRKVEQKIGKEKKKLKRRVGGRGIELSGGTEGQEKIFYGRECR